MLSSPDLDDGHRDGTLGSGWENESLFPNPMRRKWIRAFAWMPSRILNDVSVCVVEQPPLLFGTPGPGSKCDIFRMESVFKTTTQATLKRTGAARGSGEMDLILIPPKSRESKQDTRHRNLWHSVSLIIYEADWTSISGYGRVSASAGQALDVWWHSGPSQVSDDRVFPFYVRFDLKFSLQPLALDLKLICSTGIEQSRGNEFCNRL